MPGRINRALGHVLVSGPGAEEFETYTCAHCSRVRRMQKAANEQDAGKLCMACYAMMCQECMKLGHCEPFERKLEAIESRARLLAAVVR